MINPAFKPPLGLSNPHLQTILPKFIAPKRPNYRRQLFKDSLGESDVAFDFYPAKDSIDSAEKYHQPIVVLFHGLEGSSDSHYARTLGHLTHAKNWHFVVPHFRSCGDVPVSGRLFYHAGDTVEVHHYLQLLRQTYRQIFALGVSLGGNVLAKYLGEYGDDALCDKAVVVSAPVDLASASIALERFMGRYAYTPYLLNPIMEKMAEQLPTAEYCALCALKKCRRLSDFDAQFTAPRHGFRSVNAYYREASALPYLIHVTKPLLLINAQDDPFLGVTACQNDVSDVVTLLKPKHGGHIGFVQFQANAEQKLNANWFADVALNFFLRPPLDDNLGIT